MDVEVDKEFLQNLKDFKTLQDKEVVDEIKMYTFLNEFEHYFVPSVISFRAPFLGQH